MYTEQELFNLLVALFASVFFDADIANSFKLRETAKEHIAQLGKLILASLKSSSLAGVVKKIGDTIHGHQTSSDAEAEPLLKSFGAAMVARVVHETGGDPEEAVLGSLLMLVAGGVAIQTQVLSQAIDFYLDKKREVELKEIRRLAEVEGKEADEMLMR